MFSNSDLCRRITTMYPELGNCGIDIDVDFDKKNSWVVHLLKDEHALDHHLDPKDAGFCMNGKQCISLGLEIAQLKNHISGKQF